MQKKYIYSVFTLLLLLSGCASTTPMMDTRVNDNWQLNGKIGVAYPDAKCNRDNCPARSDQGRILWQQQSQRYQIEISDPFERVLIRLDGNDDNLRAQSPGKAPINATPAQFIALMVNESEQQSALSALTPHLLRHWVTGRPAPDTDVTRSGSQQFKQQGFTVAAKQWRKTTVGQMPSLVTIEKGQVKLRLVVREWQPI